MMRKKELEEIHPMFRCAVIGCANRGRVQICPYDGRYHHHGRIHYRDKPSTVEFHKDAWDYVCDNHYKLLCDERRNRQKTVV